MYVQYLILWRLNRYLIQLLFLLLFYLFVLEPIVLFTFIKGNKQKVELCIIDVKLILLKQLAIYG